MSEQNKDYGVEISGPYLEPDYRLIVGGYAVPNIRLVKLAGADDGLYSLVLDGRFGIEVTKEEIQKWAWIIANAMAIGAGYSCFGENSQPINRYRVKVMGIGSVSTEPGEAPEE